MKRLIVTIVSIQFVFMLIGCKDKMSELDNKITQLISSADVEAETKDAELANDYANANKISYSISVKSLDDGETVSVSQIEPHMNKKLQVSIQSDGNTFIWEPKK